MIMAGCSDVEVPDLSFPPGHQEQLYTDVPIEFGCGGITKAPMTTESLSPTNNFGLFSVEEGIDDLKKDSDLKIRNSIINYRPGQGFAFAKSAETCYYPSNTDKKYKFYAYYSYRNDENVITENRNDEVLETEDAIKVRFYSYEKTLSDKTKVSGTLGAHNGDVLYGKAAVGDIEAFNAPIVQEYGRPSFDFMHATTALHFTVSLNLSRDMGEYIIRVAGLRIKNSPAQADMYLINLNDSLTEGTFDPSSFVYAQNPSELPFLRNEAGNSGALNYDITTDFTSAALGAGYMFIVPQKEPLECIINIMRVNKNNPGANAPYYYEFKLDPSDYDESLTEGHEAGVLYKYNIVLDWGNTSNGSVGPIVKNATQVQASNWNTIY